MVIKEIHAGILIRKGIRDFLDDCIFKGLNISYRENKSLLASRFVLKGDEQDMSRVVSSLSDYYGE